MAKKRKGEREREKEKKDLVHFQIEWIEDFGLVLKNKKDVKKKMIGKIVEQVGDRKFAMFLSNTFYRMYLYMLKSEVKSLAVFFKEYIFACKVDVFGKNLICVAVVEEKLDEYSGEIVDYVGGKIPDAIDYNEIYKAVWWPEFQGTVKTGVAVLICLVVLFVVYRFVVPIVFPEKPKVLVKKRQQVQLNFSPEEQRQAHVLTLLQCLDGLKKKMLEYSSRDHVRVKEVRLGTTESPQSVGCNVFVVEEYDYPAPETEKTEKYYSRETCVSKSVNRQEFLKERNAIADVRRIGDYRKCLETVSKIGGEVVARKGGVASINVKTRLTPKQAALLPDFVKELVKTCGWGVLKVNEFNLNVYREESGARIEFNARLEVREPR